MYADFSWCTCSQNSATLISTESNHTILDELAVTYHTLDGLLTTQLEQTNADIDALLETTATAQQQKLLLVVPT